MLVQNNSAVHQCVEIKIPDMRTCSGDPMAGYLFIEADGFDLDADLAFWVEKCLVFNPKAKSSKQK